MTLPAAIKATFALLDVTTGRKKLAHYFKDKRPAKKSEGTGYRPVNKPIKVTIEALIVDVWGNDDGISQGFELEIKKLKVKK